MTPVNVMPTSPPKGALQSTGVWGGIIAAMGPFLDMGLSYIQSNGGVPGLPTATNSILLAASSLIGGVLAIYGRVSATQQVTGVFTGTK